MLNKIHQIFSKLKQPHEKLLRDELRLASAALLVHAAHVDGSVADEEMAAIKRLLKEKYNLTDQEISELVHEAEQKEKHAVDLYSFTTILTSHLDQEGRKEIISMLWEIVLADGTLDNYEDHLIRRVSELIGISTRDRILLRKEVEGKA